MGYEVLPINTVQFANHAGYGPVRGLRFPPDHIGDLIAGLDDRGALSSCEAVLSGYLGSPPMAEAVLAAVERVRSRNPKALFCCDPVMGDEDSGLFVDPAIPPIIRERMLACADIITPNLFELEVLSGITLNDMNAVYRALDFVHKKGPRVILLTSWRKGLHADTATTGMLVSSPEGVFSVETPLLPFPKAPHGAGDLSAALFLAYYLERHDAGESMELCAAAVREVFRETAARSAGELAIVAAQEAFHLRASKAASAPSRSID
jgi:pyridoxine kinase